ncbi:MAG TPA: hypothetical protein VN643_01830 [Pyrinomonadaceae bacterium]|nr:hypothetical protein [Pyrinomonadaceae bacterium]
MRLKPLFQFLAFSIAFSIFGFAALAQSRDHLTPQEVELVQESQVLDQRTEVFIKAIERRIMAMNGTQPSDAKQFKKDAEKWGELPKGSRAQLIGDIARILEEAITNIDDVSYHDDKNPLLTKSLRKLDTVAATLFTQLTPIGEQSKSPEEISNINQALENAQSIMDAAKKLGPPSEAEKTKGKNKKPKG